MSYLKTMLFGNRPTVSATLRLVEHIKLYIEFGYEFRLQQIAVNLSILWFCSKMGFVLKNNYIIRFGRMKDQFYLGLNKTVACSNHHHLLEVGVETEVEVEEVIAEVVTVMDPAEYTILV